jgi:DNA (cytosine-5)-methyltransferase 1
MRIGSLCTGYGGLDMAVEAYFDAETVWVSEIDKHASHVIEQRINKPNLGDLKIVNWAEVEQIDILTAGYPCQPFSHSGLRKGSDDERHLWPYIKKVISDLRPQYVILENVAGHLSLGFGQVLGDLTEIGYDAMWQVIRASEIGAPHHRARLFIIAYPASARCERGSGNSDRPCKDHEIIANADHTRRVGAMQGLSGRFNTRSQMSMQTAPHPLDQLNRLNPEFVEYMMGLPVGWVTNTGLSRTQQLKLLGNGVVPQQAYHAISLLMETVNNL